MQLVIGLVMTGVVWRIRLVIAGGGRRDVGWVCHGGKVTRGVVERFLGMRLVCEAEGVADEVCSLIRSGDGRD